MAPAAPFNPPSPTLNGKPFVPAWVPPAATKETHNFAQLTSIDLSKMDSDDPAVVAELVEEVKIAIRDDGFIFLENYGISYEQVGCQLVDLRPSANYMRNVSQLNRQFSLAQYLYNNISEEDKARLLFDPETGRWSGYKHPYGFKRFRSIPDGIEQFNWYAREWENHNFVPTCLHPFMDEIQAFCDVSEVGSRGTFPGGLFQRLSTCAPHSTSRLPSTADSSPCSPACLSFPTITSGIGYSLMAVPPVKATFVTLCSVRSRRQPQSLPRVSACTATPISA